MMIDFFRKTTTDTELDYLLKSYGSNILNYRNACSNYFTDTFRYPNFYLTKSCTQALELAILIADFPAGSEIILPSYAFVSLANAITLRGMQCVFIDCETDTMNLNAAVLEEAVTEKTRAVISLNYGGVACDYDLIKTVCAKHNLVLIEDNAHGIRAMYKNQWLGTIGDISAISFDFMKNITCNEGGGITLNNESKFKNFRTAYEMGSNKKDFFEGKAASYEWKGLGSNHLLAEPLAAILYAQLTESDKIIESFREKWQLYYRLLEPLENEGLIRLAKIPSYSQPNGHIFWLKAKGNEERDALICFLREHQVISAFHYTPLHLSEYGKQKGLFRGEDVNTTRESSCLLRLPIYHALSEKDLHFVASVIYAFYKVPFKW